MSDIYKMAENIDKVNEGQKSIADGFVELSKLLNSIEDLKNQARVIWRGIEQRINDINSLGKNGKLNDDVG